MAPKSERAKRASAADLMRLARSATYLYFAMREAGRSLGAVNEANMGVWGVLGSLTARGPSTVPKLARERPVSRQYMQKVCDALSAEGLVRYSPNPEHKRSSLVELTKAGVKRFEEINQAIEAAFGPLAREIDAADCASAIGVIEHLRAGVLAITEDGA